MTYPQDQPDEIAPLEDESVIVDEPLQIDAEPTMDEMQGDEAATFAWAFLDKVARLKGVRIDREQFLRAELRKLHASEATIRAAVDGTPVQAGLGIEDLDGLALASIRFETRKSSSLSFASGIPGGFAMLGTIPADITQYYVHAFRVMQKVAYLYGWQDLLDDSGQIDDETLGKLAAFLGVMMGVGGASTTLKTFAVNVAAPAVQKQIAKKALTKTAWYPPLKKTLNMIGVKLTRDSLAKSVSKAVPVLGGVVSGGMTLVALDGQGKRLMRHLREIPPPGVDAALYAAAVRAEDERHPDRARAMGDAVLDTVPASAKATQAVGRLGQSFKSKREERLLEKAARIQEKRDAAD